MTLWKIVKWFLASSHSVKETSTFQTELDGIAAILDHRNELILNEIRVTINSKQDEVEISNWEVELFLMEQ